MNNYYSTPAPPLQDVAIHLDDPIQDGPDEVFKGLLPIGSELLISGETNIGKSLLALEILSSFTTGEPLWGELQPSFRAKRVLYVLAEHHDAVIQKLWRKTKLPLAGEVFLLGPEALGFDKWLVSKGTPNVQAVGKFKKWAEGCDLIIWDPLAAFVTGEVVEQDNVTMRLLLDTMGLICQASGASCLVLGHQGKPQMDSYGKEHARKSYATRGASGTEDAAENIFYMGKSDADDPSQKATSGQIYELRLRKYKGEAPSEYRLLRDPETLTHRLLGNRPYSEVQKIALQAKVARIQAHNSNINYRTAVSLVAAIEGLPEETVKRHLGLA